MHTYHYIITTFYDNIFVYLIGGLRRCYVKTEARLYGKPIVIQYAQGMHSMDSALGQMRQGTKPMGLAARAGTYKRWTRSFSGTGEFLEESKLAYNERCAR